MKYSIVFILLLSSFSGFSQGVDDHINWSFQKYSFGLDDTYKIDITPIWRFNQNFSNLQNMSIDYKISRSIGNGLSVGLLGRQANLKIVQSNHSLQSNPSTDSMD